LKLKNIKTDKSSKKLDWLNAKYKVIDIFGIYIIILNISSDIHLVFYVIFVSS
jgi:hypothetical protein